MNSVQAFHFVKLVFEYLNAKQTLGMNQAFQTKELVMLVYVNLSLKLRSDVISIFLSLFFFLKWHLKKKILDNILLMTMHKDLMQNMLPKMQR